MTRAFLDSNVFLYATGAQHELREPCRLLLEAVGEGQLEAETSVEVLQEVAHVRARRGATRDDARALARHAGRICSVHAVEPEDLERALDLFAADDSLPLRDAVHAAVALNRGATLIASADRHFDRIPELRRLDPLDRDALRDLIEP